MKLKELKLYVIGSVIVIATFFGSIELATRTASWLSGSGFVLQPGELDPTDHSRMVIYQWHPFTGFTFKPNNQFISGHPSQDEPSHIMTDKHGFLNFHAGIEYNKPDNQIRIATIGGSTTAGISLNFMDNWPGQLGQLLHQTFPNNDIQIINAGTPGFDTSQSLGNLALRVMPFQPDVVIIYHAYNDLKAAATDDVFKPDYSHIHDTPYGAHEKPNLFIQFLNNSMFYVRLRNAYRDLQPEEVKSIDDPSRLKTISPFVQQTFKQHMESLVAVAQAQNAKVILTSFSMLYDTELDYSTPDVLQKLREKQINDLPSLLHFMPNLTLEGIFTGINTYNQTLKTIVEQRQTGWADIAAGISNHDEYFVDRVHFSKQGAAEFAKILYPTVIEQLTSSAN